MWEWSKSSKDKENTSLVSAYKDLIGKKPSPTSKKTSPIIDNLIPDNILSILNDKIDELNLKNIELIEKNYDPQTWEEMTSFFKEYRRVRSAFLKMLAYSEKQSLINIGLNKFDLELMHNGISPENFNVHIKIPFDFGGTLDFSNLALVKSHPAHDYLHSLLDVQIENGFLKKHKKIFIPFFEGRIYHD